MLYTLENDKNLIKNPSLKISFFTGAEKTRDRAREGMDRQSYGCLILLNSTMNQSNYYLKTNKCLFI